MQKRAESAARIRSIKREKQFKLDCTNLGASQYRQYNPLKDKFLQYIVPCPCNLSLHKCKKKSAKTSLAQSENTPTDFLSQKSSIIFEGKSTKHFIGKIIRNAKKI